MSSKAAHHRGLVAKQTDQMRRFKALEKDVLDFIGDMRKESQADGRWLSIAVTQLELGIMAANRAVADGKYPEDVPEPDKVASPAADVIMVAAPAVPAVETASPA